MRNVNRREFLRKVGAGTGVFLSDFPRVDTRNAFADLSNPTLDLHIHLIGLGDNESGCRLSKRIVAGPLFHHLLRKLDVLGRAKTLDEGYVLALAEALSGSELNKGLILAQDAVYDSAGKPDWKRTAFYVPNDYLFRVVGRYPQHMLPCVSINPDRADGIEELERCAEKGANVLKIHPPIQGVDVSDKKHVRFFQRCSELKLIVMVHTGHEHSAPVVDIQLASPQNLKLALDQGCTVVACHCGTGWQSDSPDMLPDFLQMIRKYDNLWGDTAVLGSIGRVRDLQRLIGDEVARDRLLHGSDFPFPATPMAFVKSLGVSHAVRLQAIRNPIGQDFALKDALGAGRASAERAYQLVCRQ